MKKYTAEEAAAQHPQEIIAKQTPDGVELLQTPTTSRISWALLADVGSAFAPSMQVADGEIRLIGTNKTAVYRIVGAERYAAVVELVRITEEEG
jgi:hypothetical protein